MEQKFAEKKTDFVAKTIYNRLFQEALSIVSIVRSE